ncbi:hypothetical protein KAK07_02755 [Ideonella sp. 4Y16]|uniref:hypothetical protein n=1 Tax=Ideonella alba TaxID=2824118 RepID=UPI001B36DBAF|nr:hypothetical protein [Ideonella alba]MBQ0942250.1 hypothetical protein [Ideonella alba]
MAAHLRSHPTLLAVAASLLISGCAVNPMVQRPTVAAETTANTSELGRAMDEAMGLRAAYEDKAYAHVSDQVAVNNLLFGLGVATFGLVTAGVHRDAFTTTAGLGGSLYLYSTTSKQAAHLTAYQVGIGRTNCAIAMARAQRIDDVTLSAQASDATALLADLKKLSKALVDLKMLALGLPSNDVTRQYADQRITAAQAVHDKSVVVQTKAEDLSERNKKVASSLRATTDSIRSAVNQMAAMGTPEPAAVLAALKNLASVVGGFGSAVGVTAPTAASAASGSSQSTNELPSGTEDTKKGTQTTGVTTEKVQQVRDAVIALAETQLVVEVRAEQMSKRASRLAADASPEDWTKCVPSGQETALVPSATELLFTANPSADQSQKFYVSGGSTPLYGHITSEPSYGIEVIAPQLDDRGFIVKVPKTVVGPHDLRIELADSSTPRQRKQISLKIAAAAAPAGTNESAMDLSKPLTSALEAAKKANSTFKVGTGAAAVTMKVQDSRQDASGFAVKLACTPGAKSASYTQQQTRTALLGHLQAQHRLSASVASALNAMGARLSMLDGGAGCVK